MFEELPSLCPVQFFGVSADCLFLPRGAMRADKRFLLPSTSELLDEDSFADLYVAWNFDKFSFLVDVHVPFQKVDDDVRKGDSIELFFDTRDLKSKGVVSRFCHHFVFYPAQIHGFYGREVTRFRNEDVHRLCHPEDLTVSPKILDNGYRLEIEIPAHCLTGFDPMSFPRIGFTYRINRAEGPPQHFAVSSNEYAIEQYPAMWGTLKLVKQDD
ncbi:MAG: hypothetical protein KGJ02_08345 [Verrucomicrobiota bacterium]|nr:hypothetical protein [Verrucomicrobiota bacterium]